MVPVIFLHIMIFTSSALISAERASVAYDDSAVLLLNTLDAMLPARDGALASSSVSPDVAASKLYLTNPLSDDEDVVYWYLIQ
jgi:hypothetical protein